jgi:hypothetical protein
VNTPQTLNEKNNLAVTKRIQPVRKALAHTHAQ